MTDTINSLLLNPENSRALLASLLSGLPCLLEGPPGIGKTETAKAIAQYLNRPLTRIQCTSDTLPSDVVGYTKINPVDGSSQMIRGPLFGDFILVDEINRAPPSTQSAFLEGMAEQQVTVEGQTLALPPHQNIVATQNPLEDHGTHPLPRSQLDRFAVRVQMTYPETGVEASIIAGVPVERETIITKQSIDQLKEQLSIVTLPGNSLQYIMTIIDRSRSDGFWSTGLSTRAGLILKQVAQGLAAIDESEVIHLKHIQDAFLATAPHRLLPLDTNAQEHRDMHQKWLHQIPFPI